MRKQESHRPNGLGIKHRHTTGVVLLAVVIALCGFGIQAQAGITTFVDDKAGFLAATGATSATGPLPNLGGDFSQTVGSVTFTSAGVGTGVIFIGVGNVTIPDWYPVPPDGLNDLAINGVENMNVTFAGDVYSMGFDIVEPSILTMPPWGGIPVDSTFEVTLKDGGDTVGTFQFNAEPDDVFTFIGVWSDTAFNRVEIREIFGINDDEYFGEFYTGTNPFTNPLEAFPTLFATLNGDSGINLFPGFGIVEDDGAVIETGRMTMGEAQNTFSAFGITRNSLGEYWTSTGSALIQFDPVTGDVLRSLSRVDQAFLHLVFDSSDRLIGWSNSNGFLYEISLGTNSYTETQLVFVGLHAGGLTEMEFAPDSTLYGIDNRNRRLITIDLTTGAITTVAPLNGLGSFVGLAFAPDETLFTASSLGRQLIQLDRQGNELWRGSYLSDTPILGLEFDTATISVMIDIKPGSDPNAINPLSRGVIPVAILTTDTFDATTVDSSTVQFGPDGATDQGSGVIEDVDGDGDLDLVLHFRTQETGIVCGDTEASLSGATFGGSTIEGSDSIVTVGCK